MRIILNNITLFNITITLLYIIQRIPIAVILINNFILLSHVMVADPDSSDSS